MGKGLTIIDPGALDEKITIQDTDESTNSIGEPVTIVKTSTEVWAAVRYPAGDEKFNELKETGFYKVIFLVRYKDAFLSLENLVQHGGKTYEVEAVERIGRKRFLRLITKLVE